MEGGQLLEKGALLGIGAREWALILEEIQHMYFPLPWKIDFKKQRSVIYSTDQENEAKKMFITASCLGKLETSAGLLAIWQSFKRHHKRKVLIGSQEQ